MEVCVCVLEDVVGEAKNEVYFQFWWWDPE